MQHFTRESLFEQHIPLCAKIDSLAATRLPARGSVMYFSGHKQQLRLSYFICCNFETSLIHHAHVSNYPEKALSEGVPRRYGWILFPTEKSHAENCRRCSMTRPCEFICQSSEKLCRLSMFSWAYVIVSADGQQDFPLRVEQSPNCASSFLASLRDDMTLLYKELRKYHPITISKVQRKEFSAAQRCLLCGETFKSSQDKHRDHAHHFD